ncbi:hypothetical protein CRV08_08925 [Halarcobacter ebronensis]|uniref:diguanylate cyclase n=1 Tax=Halarcobacter ebronensis TaxID=1462615 RepID=A0A4V1LRE6_9BACT|nr:diguanylate cyclase [Halarcobacter ebronensis]RXJ67928.1 hypothetical protein CRV08_08925 [Halarcobacter ebronensis]
MNLRIPKNLLYLIFIYIVLVITLGTISYKFFINDFIDLEKTQNQNNLTSLIKFMDTDLKNLAVITNDYSKWDETYDFIENKNDIYIYENFREKSSTLDDLGVDGFIFINKNGEVIYSNYSKEFHSLKLDEEVFQKNILPKLSGLEEISTLLKYENRLLYVSKQKILRSDFSGNGRGFLISVKFLNKQVLKNEVKSLFGKLQLDREKITTKVTKNSISIGNLKNTQVITDLDNKRVINYIEFYNYKGEYLSTVLVSNRSQIIIQGNRTINIFNTINSIILLFVFIVIYQKQKLILSQNRVLNNKVEKRTRQLTNAYRNLKNKNRELYKLAHTDFLTQIRNRGNFFEQSIKNLKKSNNENFPFSIIMLDLDHFKKINDTYGHDIGDKVLLEFCDIVNKIIDKDMIFGRLGGEEFAISISKYKEEDVYKISEKIRETCDNTKIKISENIEVEFTVSIGVVFKENNEESIDLILQKVDKLLYKAKNIGRNRVVKSLI